MKIKYTPKDTFDLFQHTAFGIDLWTWIRVLARNKWNVHPIYWPKAIMITLMALLSSPFHILEALLFARKIKKVTCKDPVFIVGYFRSGTTYLFYLLGSDPKFVYPSTYQVLTPHLFLLFGKGMRKLFNSVMPETRPQDNVKISAESPSEEEFALANMTPFSLVNGYVFPRRIKETCEDCIHPKTKKQQEEWSKKLDYFVRKAILANGNQQMLLKSPLNTARIDEILKRYPNARFIHIHRNPYEVYISNEGLLEKILPKMALNRAHEKELEQFIIDSYRDTYQNFLKSKQQLRPDQLVEIRYSEFEKKPMEILQQVYDQIKLGDFSKVSSFIKQEVASGKSYKKNQHKPIPREKIEQINREWDFMFQEYGYEKKQ